MSSCSPQCAPRVASAELLAALLATTLALPIPCADVDADTVAIRRETAAGWVVETSTAGGPWERALGPVKQSTAACPEIAAARDGTTVLAVDDVMTETSQVTVRRPGGAFGPPARIRHRESALQLVAAPGGRVALLWYGCTRSTRGSTRRAITPITPCPTTV